MQETHVVILCFLFVIFRKRHLSVMVSTCTVQFNFMKIDTNVCSARAPASVFSQHRSKDIASKPRINPDLLFRQ